MIKIGSRGILAAEAPTSSLPPMPAKCPYCARPLSGFGLKCRACRRYVLRWHHIVLFSLVGLVVLAFALDALLRAL